MTNAHVVAGHEMLKVTLPDGPTLPARVLAADPNHDIAALSVDANNLPTIVLVDSRQLQPGGMGLGLVSSLGGINTMITGPNVGLAVPVHTVKNFLCQALGSPSPTPPVTEPVFL